MILQSLIHYYDSLVEARDDRVVPPGRSRQKIGFIVVLDNDGNLLRIEPPPETADGGRFTLVVPGGSKPPGSGINPCFLWDNAAYLLGRAPEGREPAWAWNRFEASRDFHLSVKPHIDIREAPEFHIVCQFLGAWTPRCLEVHSTLLQDAEGFGAFRISGSRQYVHDNSALETFWDARCRKSTEDPEHGPSLISGEIHPLARLHKPKIKGVRGAQTSGALLASFNQDAFESYEKQQSFNSPIGTSEAFRYCNGLNILLQDKRRTVALGGTTVVFWTSKPHEIEDITGCVFGTPEDELSLIHI